MAWTTPTTWTAGQIPGAADLNREIKDNLNALALMPAASVYRTTNQTFTPGNSTTVTWQAALYNVGGGMWVGGAPTRLTAPADYPGLYKVTSFVQLTSGTNATVSAMSIWLAVNNVTIPALSTITCANNWPTTMSITKTISLGVGDYVETRFSDTAGATNFDEVAAAGSVSYMEARFVRF